ncbi:hypothetical protein V2J09_022186 [Rumex salicifolius]
MLIMISTSGYCVQMCRNHVIWRSKRQNVVARSSVKLNFRALAQGMVKWEGQMKLKCDDNSTISIGHNPIQNDKTKHVEIVRHFIKEKLLILVADVLTKGLHCSRFQQLTSKLEIEDIYHPA